MIFKNIVCHHVEKDFSKNNDDGNHAAVGVRANRNKWKCDEKIDNSIKWLIRQTIKYQG